MKAIVSPFGEGFGFSMKTSDDYNELEIHPEEMGLLSFKAVQKRRVEFCIGRAAAHCALSKINIHGFPILKGDYNEPLWPKGIVGAISHSGEIAIAAVARKEETAGIGIDIEKIDKAVSEDIINMVCTNREAAWVNTGKDRKLERLLMIFSAKESIFKALFPRSKVFLNYMDTELDWHETGRCFLGKLLTPVGKEYDAGYPLQIGCRNIDNYIFTFIKLPPLL